VMHIGLSSERLCSVKPTRRQQRRSALRWVELLGSHLPLSCDLGVLLPLEVEVLESRQG